ncbi:MAG TPA: hypothetical protein VFE54_00075 [Mucilaginibacter sp.]|jgi:hypothetical protein|nr:hypothetical protein [Mucilaginibacter sp.]
MARNEAISAHANQRTGILFQWALPLIEAAGALRSYCTGISHGPVSTSIANEGFVLHNDFSIFTICI